MNVVFLLLLNVLALLRTPCDWSFTLCLCSDTLVKDVDGSDGQEQACSPDNKRQPGNRQSSRRNAERHEDAESESDDEKERMVCETYVFQFPR